MCQWVLPLLGSTNLQSILSIVKNIFLFLRMLPVEPLMEVVVLKLIPRKRKMFCQTTLLADK